MAKSTRKSNQNQSRESLRGTQNRVKFGPGTPSGCPVAPKSVPRAPWEHPGSTSACPRRAPEASGGSLKAPRDVKKSAQELPGARQGDQNRHQVASGNDKREFFACGSFVKPCRSNFSSILDNIAPSKSDDVNARNTLFGVFVLICACRSHFDKIWSNFEQMCTNFEQI